VNTQTPTRPSFWSTVGIVAKREIVVRCMSKSFIISTLIILAIMFLAVVFAPQLGKMMSGGNTTVAATADLVPKLSTLPNVTVVEVADQDAARSAVLSEEANAAVVPDASNPLGLEVLSLRDVPEHLMGGLSVSPNVQLLDPNTPHPALRYFLALGFGMVWFMAVILFGMGIANSVVEEKQTRIVEILLANISSKALLTGKIIGNSAAALAQILAIAATVIGGLAINGSVLPVADLVWPIVWFVILFMFGVLIAVFVYWKNPAGNPLIDNIALVSIGFLIYGPVMMIGLHAADLVPKKATGSATGLTGLLGYLIGSSFAGVVMGAVVDHLGWDGGFYTLIIACILAIVLLFMSMMGGKPSHQAHG